MTTRSIVEMTVFALQDEARLRRALPSMFQSVAFTQMSLPLRPMFGGAPPPSQVQTEQEGRLLLSEFVTEEIRRNHVILDNPEDVDEVHDAFDEAHAFPITSNGQHDDDDDYDGSTSERGAHARNRTSAGHNFSQRSSDNVDPNLKPSQFHRTQSRSTQSTRAQRVLVCPFSVHSSSLQ